MVARLGADGSPDPTFSGDGFLAFPELDTYLGDGAYATVVAHPDPSEPGAFGLEVTFGDTSSLRRFDARGRLDLDFGDDGALLLDASEAPAVADDGPVYGSVVGWTADEAGRWLVAARNERVQHVAGPVPIAPGNAPEPSCDDGGPCVDESPAGTTMRHVWRFTTSGVADPTWGDGGDAASVDPGRRTAGDPDLVSPGWLEVDAAGRLLVVEHGASWDFDLFTRWLANGTLDAAWGGDGDATVSVGSTFGTVRWADSVSHDAAGRLVAALGSWSGAYRIVRLTDEGWRDHGFDRDGSLVLPSVAVPTSPSETPSFDVRTMPSGRILWFSERGSASCCPWTGRNDSIIGMLAGGSVDPAPPAQRITLRVAGRRCGARLSTACLRIGRGTPLVGVVRPIPDAANRTVYLTVATRCEGDNLDEAARLAVRTDARGVFRHVLRAYPKRRQRVLVFAERSAVGDHADARSRSVWLRGHGARGRCRS